ncbi:MAG: DegT/DnrJ/EryC1/StrS family aminotransferase [Candidatus Omnitrophica bacterium]|nr:DegT/DnrJ/EryC1/StrS family aminotransferase [Candidatus Omnitrophota bacterium]
MPNALKNKLIRVAEPYIGKEEISHVNDCLKRGMISGFISGDYLEEFENLVSKSCGVKYGVATTSGTTALALSVATLGLGPGDEVLVPTLTNIASAFAVVYTGAKPVFVDSEPVTWNLDPEKLHRHINRKTKAIMPVHLYGHPVDMAPVIKIAKKHNLKIIEDAAEAHGAEYHGKKIGSLGHIGCLSFFSNKIVTTGEGGMLVTNDRKIAERARFLKNLGYSNREKFLHTDLAFNYRLTNLQAALGVAQMSRFKKTIEMKRKVAQLYTQRLRQVKGLQLPPELPGSKNVYWMYALVLGKQHPNRQTVREKLIKAGVETRNFFYPMHLQPAFRSMKIVSKSYRLPVAESVAKRGLYLPSSPKLTETQIDRISKTLIKILKD